MTLNVHRFGSASGEPVLCLHGVTGHGARFGQLAALALADRRVLAPDLRGHGHSTWQPPWGVEQHVADLVALLDREAVAVADVVGHSYGGLIALHLAAAHPARVRDIVLLDPALQLDPTDARAAAEGTIDEPAWATREEAVAARAAGRSPEAAVAAAADAEAHLEHQTDGTWRLRFCRAAAVVGWSEMARPQPHLALFGGRVLVVSAAREDYVRDLNRAALGRELGDRFSETPLDCGHMLFWDLPEATAHAVQRHLAARA